jgi:ribonuclease R
MELRKRRMKAGAINLILPEVKIDLDDDGRVSGAHTVDNTESHQVIEEFMLAGNEAVARRMADEELFYLRRIHPQPSEQKLTLLTEFVQQLGIECESLKSRFEIKRVIEESDGMPQRHAVHYAVLRSMQKAVYSPEEIGHYALNSENYCHFTSPIRRYPDLVIHRMVGDLIDGKKPDANFERLSMLGKHCSDLEKRATDAERDLIKLKLLNFMADKVGMRMHAVITGVEAFGVFAQGVEIPAEGMIPLANLPTDTYQFERDSRTLSGFKDGNEYRLGDQIQVQVAVVDPDQRTLEFEIFGVQPSRGNVTRRSKSSHGSKSKQGSSSKPRTDSKSGSNVRSRSNSKSRTESRSEPDSRSRPIQKQKPKSESQQELKGQVAQEKQTRTSSDDWGSTRASGPQKGQKKKRRVRDVEAQPKSKKKSSKARPKKQKKSEPNAKSKTRKPGKPKAKSKSTSPPNPRNKKKRN